jgi:competence protein ComEC
MKISRAQIPLVRLLIPFAVGVFLAWNFRFDFLYTLTGLLIPILLVFLLVFPAILRRNLNFSGLDGAVIYTVFFLLAIQLTYRKIPEYKNQENPLTQNTRFIYAQLVQDPQVKERSVKLQVQCISQADSLNQWISTKENTIFYLERNRAAEELRYGDRILIKAKPQLVKAPLNPGEFDYRVWLQQQEIYKTAYVKTERWNLIGRDHGHAFKAAALNLRRFFLQEIYNYGFTKEQTGVAAALLLGSSDQIDPGLLQAYSASGTLHVLSVSGMHVALVYILLLRLLSPLQRNKYGKWLSIFIQLLFIWFYAVLTGFCPSVLRAVTMLSVIIIGKSLNRQAHTINSLAASALLLLLIDPLLLLNIGFQLSYLAVSGIVLLQPLLEKKWEAPNWITRQIWTLISVTLVAQIFTFPLGLYYFRQFPTYFLLSNLFVIPLSTAVMYIGLLFLLVAPFALIGKPVAWLFGALLSLLNISVQEIESLPLSVLRSSNWRLDELLLLFFLIVAFSVYLYRKRKIQLQLGLTCLLILFLSIACTRKKQMISSELIFFSNDKSGAVGFLDGRNGFLLADTALINQETSIDFHLSPYFENKGIYDFEIKPFSDTMAEKLNMKKGCLYSAGKLICIPQIESIANDCDILYLRKNLTTPIDSLVSKFKPELVICDGSSFRKNRMKWKKHCEERRISFMDMSNQPALILSK